MTTHWAVCPAFLFQLDFLAVFPQFFDVVVDTGFGGEEMDNDMDKIKDEPAAFWETGFAVALDAEFFHAGLDVRKQGF